MNEKRLYRTRRELAKRRRECRTFGGYIGLIDGRPDVDIWPSAQDGSRVVHVFTNERAAKGAYEDVALVTVAGIWQRRRRGGPR